MMRKVFIALFYLVIAICELRAQQNQEIKSFERQGFTFGLSVGAGALTLSTHDSVKTTLAATLPNLRIGYVVSSRLALQLLLPGSPYQYQGKARGFEGILISGQYWVKDSWWVLGGLGLTLDAPAFWTIKEPKQADFRIGFPALAFAAGHEVYQKKNFTIDIQYRFYAGQVELDGGGKRQGFSNMLSVGFNWH